MAQPHEVIRSMAEYKNAYFPKETQRELKKDETPEELGEGLARDWGKEAKAFIQAFVRGAAKPNQEETQDADI